MSRETLQCTVDDGVALLTLNRPAVHNALSSRLRTELVDTVSRLDGDDAVRAIVLTGADPAFSAGVDVRELASDPEVAGSVGPLTAPVLTAAKPLIGAVNGPAYTGGLELALACHFLIASERAVFADTHARLGLMPGWGLTVLLSEAVGVRRARQMSVSSQPIDGVTALAWGLVNEVVGHQELLPRAIELGRQVGRGDAATVRRTLRLYDDQAAVRDSAAWRLEAGAWRTPRPGDPTGGGAVDGRPDGR